MMWGQGLGRDCREDTALPPERRRRAVRGRHAALPALCAALALLSACGIPGALAGPAPTPTFPPIPANAPRTAPDPALRIVNQYIAHMSLDDELGQLFVVVYPSGDPNSPELQELFGTLGAGAVIVYGASNIFSIPQMQQLTQAMQATARIPLIISADEEGGGDDQINQIFGDHPSASDVGATGDPAQATQLATRIGGELQQLGINADFAPVVDVESADRRWLRSFGGDPTMVTQMGGAYMQALQGMGIMACLKHFPGLGAADVNPHDALPIINSSMDYIESTDLAPYKALIPQDPAMIMTTDLLMPAIDPTMPAELSQPTVTGVLRKQLGYDGVVVTDALYMGGISAQWTLPQAGVLAIEAGNDMLEGAWGSWGMIQMEDALRQAIQAGQITKARIDESVRRILLLKLRFHLLPVAVPPGEQRAGAMLPAEAATPAGATATPTDTPATAPTDTPATAPTATPTDPTATPTTTSG